jgi:hypothetical protein
MSTTFDFLDQQIQQAKKAERQEKARLHKLIQSICTEYTPKVLTQQFSHVVTIPKGTPVYSSADLGDIAPLKEDTVVAFNPNVLHYGDPRRDGMGELLEGSAKECLKLAYNDNKISKEDFVALSRYTGFDETEQDEKPFEEMLEQNSDKFSAIAWIYCNDHLYLYGDYELVHLYDVFE